MLHKKDIGESKFRILDSAELEFVSGGNLHIDNEGVDPLLVAQTGVFAAYDPDQDYCGSGIFNMPDSVYGVDISYACYTHDNNYSENSTMDRADADWQFAMDIYQTLVDGGVSEGAAGEVAMMAHGLVRFGGIFAYDGQGANN